MSKQLIEQFESYVPGLINEKGIFPAPMMVLKADGSFEIHALDLAWDQAWQHFLLRAIDHDVVSAMFGIDRTTRSGQGTEFKDVLSCVLYEKPTALEYRIREQFRFGVINYQHEPRIVRSLDWDNVFWRTELYRELCSFLPSMVIRKRA